MSKHLELAGSPSSRLWCGTESKTPSCVRAVGGTVSAENTWSLSGGVGLGERGMQALLHTRLLSQGMLGMAPCCARGHVEPPQHRHQLPVPTNSDSAETDLCPSDDPWALPSYLQEIVLGRKNTAVRRRRNNMELYQSITKTTYLLSTLQHISWALWPLL